MSRASSGRSRFASMSWAKAMSIPHPSSWIGCERWSGRRWTRARCRTITADMYTDRAGATGFDAARRRWVQAGGIEQWVERLKDPVLRAKALAEMRKPDASENTKLVVEEPDKVILVGFKTDAL